MKFANLDKMSQSDFELFDSFFLKWIPAYQEIWVFGMGDYGKAIRNFLKECGFVISGFVVSAPEKNYAEDSDPVMSISEFKAHHHSAKGKRGLIMGVSSLYYAEILPKLYFAYDDMYFFDETYKELISSHCGARKGMKISWHLTSHCNLSCYSCQIAAPIAPKRFYDLAQYKKELRRVYDLLGERLIYIGLTAAEPLLHPEFLEFVVCTRQISSAARIHVITNGLLLGNQSDTFWSVLSANQVKLSWTKYPVKYPFDVKDVFAKAEQFGALLEYVGDSSYMADKESWEMRAATKGGENPWDYIFCFMHNNCIAVNNRRLYTCHKKFSWEYCAAKFNIDNPVCNDDGLDIFQAETGDELLEFVSQRPRMCAYCKVRDFRCIGSWLPSKRERGEWFCD
ncbi:MAG: radical SAM protein [Gracilibacteraceae bacterium]|jgi:hypothetical protein|nr:radical SAM protein [Gracilibacteraceae bacterium]